MPGNKRTGHKTVAKGQGLLLGGTRCGFRRRRRRREHVLRGANAGRTRGEASLLCLNSWPACLARLTPRHLGGAAAAVAFIGSSRAFLCYDGVETYCSTSSVRHCRR